LLKFKWETKLKEVDFGEVPYDWEERVLYDLAEWINGYPFAQKTLNVEQIGLPVIKIAELNDGIKESTQYYNGESEPIYVLEKGDLLFAWSASVGVYIWRGSQALLNQHIFKVLPKIDKRFLYFLLRELNFIFQSIVEDKATTMGHVTIEDLKRIKTYLPSSPEQSRIATILSWLDDLIENKIRQNEILENIAMAIFKSWFMYFEPFKSSAFVDSELGKIPEGWGIKRVSDVADIFLGGTPRREVDKYWNGTIKWASAKDIASTQGLFILETAENISQEGLDHSNAKILPQNSIVITARGTVGEIRLLGDAITFNQTCYGLVPKNDMNSYYLFLSLRRIIAEIKALSYGTVFDTITMRNFDEMKISIPPNLILEKFHSIVEPLFQKILLNQKQIMILRKVRDVLLPLLVFGKLRVEEI